MNDGKLQGKVALVTGASSGIEEPIALALAAEGAQVALAARRIERLEALAQRIAESGGAARALTCDVADEQQVRQAAQQVQDKWGRLDILINNAGVAVLGQSLGPTQKNAAGVQPQCAGPDVRDSCRVAAHEGARWRTYHQHFLDGKPRCAVRNGGLLRDQMGGKRLFRVAAAGGPGVQGAGNGDRTGYGKHRDFRPHLA